MSRKKAEIILFMVFLSLVPCNLFVKNIYICGILNQSHTWEGKKQLAPIPNKKKKTEKLPFEHNYFQILSIVQYLNR